MIVASVDPVLQFRLSAMFSLLIIKVKLPLFLIRHHIIYTYIYFFPHKIFPFEFSKDIFH